MRFSEAIKVRDGVFYNLPLHAERMNRTARRFFGRGIELSLEPVMIPPELRAGLVKCRVVYGAGGIEGVEFAPYAFRRIDSVALAVDDTIDYTCKSVDRGRLAALLAGSGCDEVIIVKDGRVTDASSSNLVLETASGALYTPRTPLLAGTKRESLLRAGRIAEREILPADLPAAARILLINAMIDLADNVVLPRNIRNFTVNP